MVEEHKAIILVVEDDPSLREILAFLLEDEGYDVVQAADGLEALELLERESPGLIISDIMMPGMDGIAFYERIRTRPHWSQIPFIFLTAKGQRTDIRLGMGLGADDYLTKPFEPTELLAAVRVRLARAAESKAALSKVSFDLSQRIIQTLTHEFRTPLALVAGYTDLLEASGDQMDAEERLLILEGLQSGSERLSHLVEDFLLLSHLESGALADEIRRQPRQVESPDWIVRMVVEELESRAATRKVTIATQLETPDTIVAISRQALAEIIRKLTDNAIKFCKVKGGCVRLTTRCEEGVWVLSVADDGIGIRPEAQAWIFDAMRQVDRDRLEQQGAGVGLAIVRGLTELYGGRVAVKSEPGQGSLFRVWLPLAEANQGDVQPAP